MFDKLKKVKGRYYFLVLVIILSTLSGVLTIGREMYSGGMYYTFDQNMIEMADYIKENTDKDAVFLTSTTHINPVASLSGRTVYVGSSLYVYFHGFDNEFFERSYKLANIYQGSYEEVVAFCKENNISYIYVGGYERSEYQVNEEMLNRLEKVASFGSEELYKVL